MEGKTSLQVSFFTRLTSKGTEVCQIQYFYEFFATFSLICTVWYFNDFQTLSFYLY